MSVITVFAQLAGVGYRLRLTVQPANDKDVKCRGVTTDPPLDLSLEQAFKGALKTIGEPDHYRGAICSFKRLNGNGAIPPLEGGSLYGAFSMALLQFLAPSRNESGMRRQNTAVLNRGLLCADLSCIAVSAERDPATGDFLPSGGIEQKLKALALLDENELFACVLARGQEANAIKHGSNGDYIIRETPDHTIEGKKQKELPIIYAADPVDAVLRVFELQTKAVKIA